MRLRLMRVIVLATMLVSTGHLAAEEAAKHVTDVHPKEAAKHVSDLHEIQKSMTAVSGETARQLQESLDHLQRAQEEGRPLTASEKQQFDDAMLQTQAALNQQAEMVETTSSIMQSLNDLQQSVARNITE